MTETVPVMPLVTYAARSVGCTATQRGSWPTAISASLLATSLPFWSFTWMIETLSASRLTTTRRVSSEVRAMVVERVGAAIASLVCRALPRPRRATKTITSIITERKATHPSSPRNGDDRIKVVGIHLRRFIVDSSSPFPQRALYGNQSSFSDYSHPYLLWPR